MFQHQLIEAKESLQLKSISGLCSDTQEWLSIFNESMRRLMRRGNFFDTEQLMRVCIYNGCITWPRIVGTVLGIRFCHDDQPEIHNNWWTILGPRGCDEWTHTHTMHDINRAPCYNEITGDTGKYLRVYPTKLEDVGKKITFFGLLPNHQPLQQKIGGIWQRGLTLTIQAPYVQSSVLVQKITSVTKEVTQANILVYEYDPTTATQRDLALYEPTETNPRYRRTVIERFNCIPNSCTDADGVKLLSITALVKFAFIEVRNDEDFLPIDNFDALKFMFQAVRLEESGQDQEAEGKILKAIRELNFEDRDKSPSRQTTIHVHTSDYISNPI